MCGIVGVFRCGGTEKIDTSELTRMRETMVHRGPDDHGIFVSPENEIGLAFRRLAIIDLSPTASQPMSNQDGSLWIVFNGEIYNHAELRPELEKRGRKFKTDHSDTEVILKGYEEWGEDILPKLRGMFAFAIWDKRKGKLWIARDRMGVKPLYYTMHNGMFVFASEIKAILARSGVRRAVHPRAFYDFLTFLVSPAPQTLFDGIFKLPASHTLTVHADGRMETKRYWNPFNGMQSLPKLSEGEWIERLVSKLRESIRYRMVSDVNFGVFLSGGIDSSTNVALMAEQMSRPVETFSIGFEGAEKFNEMNYARQIVARYKTHHHETTLTPRMLMDFLPKLVHHQDEPIVDPVCVPVYYVSKLAKDNGTTVCQVGEGADELFCGYPYWGMTLDSEKWIRAYQFLPKMLRMGIFHALDVAHRGPSRGLRRLDVIRRASEGQHTFWGGAEAYQETVKQRFLRPSFLRSMDGYTSYEPIRALYQDFQADAPEDADVLHWMSYLDLRLRLPELLLMRVDKMTMATAVESRVPFLDQEFVTLSMGIPRSIKYKDHVLKYILKKAVEPLLPHEIIYRKKQGFGVPVAEWFEQKNKQWVNDKIMAFAKRTEYFDPVAVERYLQATSTKMSWFLLNYVLWHESWIEQKPLDLPA